MLYIPLNYFFFDTTNILHSKGTSNKFLILYPLNKNIAFISLLNFVFSSSNNSYKFLFFNSFDGAENFNFS
jgi:hypothetical protein